MVIVPTSVPVVGLPTVVMVTLFPPKPPAPVMIFQPNCDGVPLGKKTKAVVVSMFVVVVAVIVRFVGSNRSKPV